MAALKITGQSAEPTVTGSDAGTLYYDSDTNKLRHYNGTAWADVSPAAAALTSADLPAGSVIQTVTGEYNMPSGTSFGMNGVNGLAAAAETSTSLRFSIIPKSASSKIIVRYQSVVAHVNNKVSYYAIGHEVTASGGTATAATMLSQLLTVNAESDDRSYFRYGEISNYSYHPIVLEVFHSPSYTVGQKIWYSIFGYANDAGYFYFAEGDVRFKAMEIKG